MAQVLTKAKPAQKVNVQSAEPGVKPAVKLSTATDVLPLEIKPPRKAKSTTKPSAASKNSSQRTNSKQAAGVTKGQGQSSGSSVLNKATTKATAKAIPVATLSAGTDASSRSSAMLGSITGLYGDVLQGWAMDADSPDAMLAVEIYYDDVFGHLVRADEYLSGLQDTGEAIPDGAQWHGFVAQLDKQWLSGASKITARVANQGPWLAGTVFLGQGQNAQVADQQANRVFHGGGLKLVGWAWAGAQSKAIRQVSVFESINGELREILTVPANRSLSELSRKPHQGHGFVINLPSSLADGKRHQLELITDKGEPVNGSPIELCLTSNTLSGLVKDAWASGHGLDAILPILTSYERQYPVSFGFDHYAAWCDLYQIAPPQGETALRCAVVVITPETDAADAHADQSVQSVFGQRLPENQVECFKASAQAIIKGLAAAADMADVVVPLWAGDKLLPHALDVMAAQLETYRALHTEQPGQTEQIPKPSLWGYVDDDVMAIDASHRTDPWLKPDWDETLFYSLDYVSRGVFLSSDLVKTVLTDYGQTLEVLITLQDPASAWHAFMACVVAHTTAMKQSPIHVRQVLYQGHERHPSDSSRLAAMSWLANHQMPGAQVGMEDSVTRVVWPMPDPAPLVSVIVPTRNSVELLRVVIDGLITKTQYPELEVLVVNNDSDCAETLAYLNELEQSGITVLSYPKPFNYSAINNMAAEAATGELLLFLNNDVEIVDPRWLTEMVVQFGRDNVGVVGKKLLWPNGLVQHGGVVVGVNGLAAHAFNDCWQNDPGYMGLNRVDREQSAVTGACLMIRREDFLEAGGLDETNLPVAFNDVDLCLRIRESGKRVVLTTRFPLIHHESATRGKEDTPQKQARARRERQYFMRRWMTTQTAFTDPYYHPGLNQDFLVGPYGGLGRVHDKHSVSAE
ncbi:glycosyltransferase family 2 protein [Orrella daihaiensis]|uniref:Glycosyltransferase family 2 protein n=1 Tax=Orrella daihaiensis TaxID=2782176 RepID=A0ABY4AMB2_9BURK|nr:glycosyltransferase family 2 protein [Orrella daihaiensis]UOD51417.1 glycosyltransferase family 2 protein [Orrella daihaiensis]